MWIVGAVVLIFFWLEYHRAKKNAANPGTPAKTKRIGGSSAAGNQWDNGSSPTLGTPPPCDSSGAPPGIVFATQGGENGSATAKSPAVAPTSMILGKHGVLLAGDDPTLLSVTPTPVSGVKNAVTHTRRTRRSS